MKKSYFKFLFVIITVFILLFIFLPFEKIHGAKVTITEPPRGVGLNYYIRWLFVTGLSIVGISALVMIIYGGIYYLTAGESVARRDEGKDIIKNALMGMGLLIISVTLLETINPHLIRLKSGGLSKKTITKIANSLDQGNLYNCYSCNYDYSNCSLLAYAVTAEEKRKILKNKPVASEKKFICDTIEGWKENPIEKRYNKSKGKSG